ncbi:MAG TPA: tetratricopeptide repeat protein [Bryobacteraceae bacterium]
MRKGFTITAACLAGLMALFSAGCDKLKSRDHINQGIAAFKNAKYGDAVEHFKQAAALDPTNNNAVVYMATSYFAQWIPGAESPENMDFAAKARESFLKALETDPNDKTVLKYLGAMAYSQAGSLPQDQKLAKFDEAEQWYKKLIAVDPSDKEAYYTIAVIDYDRFHPALMLAKVDAHMRPEDPGPLKDKKVREDLTTKYSSTIDDGIQNLNKALDLDKEYDDAMAYLNLMIREKATLLDNKDEYAKQEQIANDWLDKAMATRKDKAAKASKQPGGIVQDK